SDVFWLEGSFCNPALQTIEEMLGMALDDELNIARAVVFTRFHRTDENIRKLGLHLRMKVDFRLFHPDDGIRWAVEWQHQCRKDLGNSEADVGDLHFRCGWTGFDEYLVFFSPQGDRFHREPIDHSQVFQPRGNEGLEGFKPLLWLA